MAPVNVTVVRHTLQAKLRTEGMNVLCSTRNVYNYEYIIANVVGSYMSGERYESNHQIMISFCHKNN